MAIQLTKELINSWEWLDSFCLTQRGDCDLACGQHAIVVVQIDDFSKLRIKIGKERTDALIANMDNLMQEFALEDTIVAKYDDSTFAVVLHYLTSREEIETMCNEIKETVREAAEGWEDKITVSIGAAECHHDPNQGYKCATLLAMDALKEARDAGGNCVVLAPDTLPLHPLHVAKLQNEEL